MLELDRNSINSDEARDLERVGYALANAAGEAILPYFRGSDLDTVSKEIERYDPVTNADRAAERAMRNVLTTLRPQDGVLGEEFGTLASESGLTWVLDPIDGTRGFVSGTPTWGTLIALSDEQGPFFGIIDQPYIKERFVGGLGQAFAHDVQHGEGSEEHRAAEVHPLGGGLHGETVRERVGVRVRVRVEF